MSEYWVRSKTTHIDKRQIEIKGWEMDMWNFSHNHEKQNLSKQTKDDKMFFSIISQILQNQHQTWEGLYQRSTRVTFSTSRREWEFLLFNLVHRDETRIFWHLISGFETRSRKILLQSQASRRDRDLLSSFSGFETRTRILLIWSHFSSWEREF